MWYLWPDYARYVWLTEGLNPKEARSSSRCHIGSPSLAEIVRETLTPGYRMGKRNVTLPMGNVLAIMRDKMCRTPCIVRLVCVVHVV